MADTAASSFSTVSLPVASPQPRWITHHTVVPIALGLTAVIALCDWVTGIEQPFTLLYVLPIALGAWFRGRRAGNLLAALATICGAAALVHDQLSVFITAWNAVGAAALYIAASWGVDQIRRHVDHERALRYMAVDQLRHAERLNVIGTLAAGVAHEIGTPLNVIAGCAELLAEADPSPRVQARTTMVLDQVTKVSSIIRRLLDFGRRGGNDRSNADLAAIAQAACDMLATTARKHHIEIELDARGPVHVSVNVAEIEQVLTNLLMNAMHAMHSGTIRVCVDSTNEHLARLAVIDQGSGIPAENLPRIFDPFFTTKGVGEGTGLGLSVSYGIVRDHAGTISVTSELRRGSTFTVLLPLRS
ncbi:MAG TPA: HAMP domain-containing sensor histidine kinase [Kofleriaceae bacterium]|jgi:signal transduction histidine kinase